jgi:excisionase family DNA binding protein
VSLHNRKDPELRRLFGVPVRAEWRLGGNLPRKAPEDEPKPFAGIRCLEPQDLDPKWYTVAQVASLLGYGETKVRMLIISGDLRSLKDGRSRRVLPEWVEDYVRLRASQAKDT